MIYTPRDRMFRGKLEWQKRLKLEFLAGVEAGIAMGDFVSDNGPPFQLYAIKQFFGKNKIKHY